jgi:hypothetical protein
MTCELKPTSVYIVEHPDGLCRIHSSPTADVIGSKGERDFEEQLCAEFVWVENLGIIFARADGTFAAEDCYKLVLPSSKRMVLVSDWDTPEYRPCDWSDLPLM